MTTPALPCLGHQDVYDALFEDENPERRMAAHRRAVALCSRCPAPCDQKVTDTSGPRRVELLPNGWMPPAREGRPSPVVPEGPSKSPRTAVPAIRRSYIPPGRRVQHWARWAGELAAAGVPLAGIADHLCVTEDTAQELLEMTHTSLREAS